MRKGKRPVRRRTSVAMITDRAVDLFDTMQALRQRCSCGRNIFFACDACKEYTQYHRTLRQELKLRPWEYPAYGDWEDTNKTGVLDRYVALMAASDARKQLTCVVRQSEGPQYRDG
jgi:hypothetical protein